MNEDKLREELIDIIKDLQNLVSIITGNKKLIEDLGRKLLEELRKIAGWEKMIKSCKSHYLQYPDDFFNWCSVDFNYYPPSIEFIKGYSGGDEYTVLSIRLDMNLLQQVINAQENIEEEN